MQRGFDREFETVAGEGKLNHRRKV